MEVNLPHTLINTCIPINEGTIPPLTNKTHLFSVNSKIVYSISLIDKSIKPIKFTAEIVRSCLVNNTLYVLTLSNLYSVDVVSLEKTVLAKVDALFFLVIDEAHFVFFQKSHVLLFNSVNNKVYKKKVDLSGFVSAFLCQDTVCIISKEKEVHNLLISLHDFSLQISNKLSLNSLLKEATEFNGEIYFLNDYGNLCKLKNNSCFLIPEFKKTKKIQKFQIFEDKIALIKDDELFIYNFPNGEYLCQILYASRNTEDISLNLPGLLSWDSTICVLEDYKIKYEIQSINEISDILYLKNKVFVGADHLYVSSNNIVSLSDTDPNLQKKDMIDSNTELNLNSIATLFIGEKIIQPESVISIKVDPINELLFICTSNLIKVYEPTSMLLIYESEIHKHQITSMDLIHHNNSFYISSVSKDLSLQISEYKYDRPNDVFEMHNLLTKIIHVKEINCIKFLIKENNLFLISGSNDKTINIHFIKGKLMRTLKSHTKGVWCLEVYKDYLISSSSDMTICVYDLLNDFTLIQKIEEHKSAVVKLIFFEEGFFSSDLDGIIKYFAFKKGVFKLKGSYNLSNERVWSLFKIQSFLGVGDADGNIYILKNVEKELKEIKKAKEVEIKERDFKLTTLKTFPEKLKLLFSSLKRNEEYAFINFLNENISSLKTNENEILKVFKSNPEKTIHVLNILSKNVKNLEVFLFLLNKMNDKKLNENFKKQINKYFEFIENLRIDLIECDLLIR